jgi:hypothetical protein
VVELKVDIKSALALARNPVFHERNKHIDLRYHFFRNCLAEGTVSATYINTGASTAAAVVKGSAMPAAGPIGALVLAAKKGRRTRGWGCAAAVAPAVVSVGAPMAMTAPVARSQEAVAAASMAATKAAGATSTTVEATVTMSKIGVGGSRHD